MDSLRTKLSTRCVAVRNRKTRLCGLDTTTVRSDGANYHSEHRTLLSSGCLTKTGESRASISEVTQTGSCATFLSRSLFSSALLSGRTTLKATVSCGVLIALGTSKREWKRLRLLVQSATWRAFPWSRSPLIFLILRAPKIKLYLLQCTRLSNKLETTSVQVLFSRWRTMTPETRYMTSV